MGSIISLGVGNLEIDWGKNHSFRDHSPLFLPGDVFDAPYYYADDVVERKPAFVRQLRSVVRRLEMLGYGLGGCREKYDELVQFFPDWYDAPALAFDEFLAILAQVDVRQVSLLEHDGSEDSLGRYVLEVLRDPEFIKSRPDLVSFNRDQGTFFENLDPYVVLRAVAENSANLDADVIWRHMDVLEGGYVERDEICHGPSKSDKWLLVTEGSSDALILQNALPVVAADVADFFQFIDMSANYPFTGTGNVYRFVQGLVRIHILNKVVVVLDNDAAGRLAQNQITSLALPENVKVTVLPDLEECRSVRSIGPAGSVVCDVNGRATSIECFLDIWHADERPIVRWTAYIPDVDAWQGEIVRKAEYTKDFLESIRRGNRYDFSRSELVWDQLQHPCTR